MHDLKVYSCVLTNNHIKGFHVISIWPACSNGSEVNSVDVCMEKGLVVTANDCSGLTRLFNYPCVVKVGERQVLLLLNTIFYYSVFLYFCMYVC